MGSGWQFNCATCGAGVDIRPIFGIHDGVRHEAVAIFTFKAGGSGDRGHREPTPGGCQIIYDGKEYANPSRAAKEIRGYEVNGWVQFWRYEATPGRLLSLGELAAAL